MEYSPFNLTITIHPESDLVHGVVTSEETGAKFGEFLTSGGPVVGQGFPDFYLPELHLAGWELTDRQWDPAGAYSSEYSGSWSSMVVPTAGTVPTKIG